MSASADSRRRRSRSRSPARSAHHHRDRISNKDSRLRERNREPDRTKVETSTTRPRPNQDSPPPRRRRRSPGAGRRDARPPPSRFDRVRVKQEPVSSEDETRDRSRPRGQNRQQDRVAVKSEYGAAPRRTGGGGGPGQQGGGGGGGGGGPPDPPKEKPNFGLSGKLAEDTNVYNGVVVKYSEPVEGKKPRKKWRLYPFKGDAPLPMLPIHRQSAYLLGRERRVADIPIDHPSCSKQHAVLQYRMVPYEREDGRTGRRVLPYIIDLESANGTFVNNKQIEARRYVELMEKDVIKFGFSSREFVLLHEGSAADDDVDEEPEDIAAAAAAVEKSEDGS